MLWCGWAHALLHLQLHDYRQMSWTMTKECIAQYLHIDEIGICGRKGVRLRLSVVLSVPALVPADGRCITISSFSDYSVESTRPKSNSEGRYDAP
jgi:hypothetical protein